MRKIAALAALIALAAPAVAQIDGSGTITAGGTSQVVFTPAGANPRTYLFCQNPIAATEPLLMNAPGAAGPANGSFEMAPGGSITFADGFIPQGQVSVYAVTAGHRFICKRG